jgi:cobalamin transport system substrate-binding protein
MLRRRRVRCTTRRACVWASPTISKKRKPRADPAGAPASGRARGARLALLLLGAVTGLAVCRGDRGAPTSATPRPTPSRVVALAPNLTEIVFALGAGDTLVGVSEYSDFPPAARAIPRIGGMEVSAERVLSLRPDLVLATREGNTRGPVAALQAAGIPVLVVPSGSLDEVLAGIRLVAGRLGRAEAGERLVQELSLRRLAVRELAARGPKPRAILLIWPDPPQAAGGGTFLDDVLVEAGGVNVLEERRGWPLVSPEFLAATPVDVLVIPDSEANRGAYERAFREGALSRGAATRARVVRVDESALTRPGPRVFDALEALARGLRGRQP